MENTALPIVGVQFEDKYGPGYGGRVYSYYDAVGLKKGDVVMAPTQHGAGRAMVVTVDVPESTIAAFKDKVRTIDTPPVEITAEPTHVAKLDNWSVVDDQVRFIRPDAPAKRLSGTVSNHPRFEDGTIARTARVVTLDLKNRTAKTANTAYELGTINPEYLAWCNLNQINL